MGWMPGAVAKPVPSHSGPMSLHLGLVLHVQVGDGSCYGEFANPANQASSTWWVSKAGTIEQYVDSDLAAWCEAAGNFTWDSVETEGVPGDPLTVEQVAGVARIYAWGHRTYGWPFQLSDTPSTPGLGWHGMGGTAWGGHFGCPGDLRKAQRGQIIGMASQSFPDTPPFKEPNVTSLLVGSTLHVWWTNPATGQAFHWWQDQGQNAPDHSWHKEAMP